MRFHPSVVEQIIYNCRNFGGHASEKKLRDILSQKRYAVYSGDRQDIVLVDADQYINEAVSRHAQTNSIIPMSLHPSAFEKVLYYFDLFSGYDTELKLRNSLSKMEFTPYERKLTGNDMVLVLTEDYMKILQGTP
jgi:hypothetical protein